MSDFQIVLQLMTGYSLVSLKRSGWLKVYVNFQKSLPDCQLTKQLALRLLLRSYARTYLYMQSFLRLSLSYGHLC